MKTILWRSVLLAAVLTPAMAGAVPTGIPFTARFADNGQPLSGSHTIDFRLFDNDGQSQAGNQLWWKSYTSVSIDAGIASVVLDGIDPGLFNGSPLYLEVALDGTTLTPRIQILSVPYALRAGVAEQALQAATAQKLGTLSQTDLSAPGHINASGNPVDWTKLANVPPIVAKGGGALTCSQVTSNWIYVAPGSYASAQTNSCPQGTVLTGGGINTTSDSGYAIEKNAVVFQNWAFGSVWVAGARHTNATTDTFHFQVFGICCSIQ